MTDGRIPKARYTGPDKKLKGKTALVRTNGSYDTVDLQFDDLALKELAHGWHTYKVDDLELYFLDELND